MKKTAIIMGVLIIAVLIGGLLWARERNQPANTAEWATYIGHELGFQIKHPREWRHEHCLTDGFGIVGFGEGEEQLLICNSDAPPLSYVNVAVVGLASDYDTLVKNLSEGLEDSKREDILVAGQNAVKISGETPEPGEGPGLPEGIKQTYIALTHNNKIYLLMHFNLENKNYIKEFNGMVQSFQFIDSVPPAGGSPTPSN